MYKLLFIIIIIASTANVQAMVRNYISVVGSSTVYPFATVVAQRFGQTTRYKTPKVEATGSGGGLKLFCKGLGNHTPDISNASRRIKASELKLCNQNGVYNILEVAIGFDGIVLAHAKQDKQFKLSLKDIYLALAKVIPDSKGKLIANTNQTWQDVNQSLPNIKIKVLGPPPTSGTRDAFVELVMEQGCNSFKFITDLKQHNKAKYTAVCHSLREDGVFIESGENDNLIIKKLVINPSYFGLLGFSFLEQNTDQVQPALINNISPSFETISDASYPAARSLYFYVKTPHYAIIKGLQQYVSMFGSSKAIGIDGYLTDRGLIPLISSNNISPAKYNIIYLFKTSI